MITSSQQQQILSSLQDQGFPAIIEELTKLRASADTPWKSSLLQVALDLVATNGADGISSVRAMIQQVLSQKVPDLSGLSLREASDLLAILEREEADTRNEVKAFLNSLLNALIKITGILVITLFKEI